jgi:hypothetical protein
MMRMLVIIVSLLCALLLSGALYGTYLQKEREAKMVTEYTYSPDQLFDPFPGYFPY